MNIVLTSKFAQAFIIDFNFLSRNSKDISLKNRLQFYKKAN
jgi:hypothetical protein